MKQMLSIVSVLAVACCLSVLAQETPVLKLSEIAPQNIYLERTSGHWNTTVRIWTSEKDTAAVESKGRCDAYMRLGGRVQMQRDSTRIGSKVYEDLALLSYDPEKHQFVVAWTDAINPGMLMLTGTLNDSGNILTLHGERENAKGAKTNVEMIYSMTDGSHMTLEIWETPASGKKRMTMEIIYRRGF
jgi:hypothetical protein